MMTDLFIYLVSGIIGVLMGVFLARKIVMLQYEKKQAALQERNSILNQSLQNTTEDLKFSQEEKELLITEKTRLETELKNSTKKILENNKELEKIQDKFTKEFENLANKILDEKSLKFTEQNKLNITNILTPLKEKIEGFEKKVTESQKESIGMHSALKEQLNHLKDLNIQMSKEAVNLTKALKGDSKAQGDWGETQLEILLEKANLTKEIHYTTQGGFRDDEGRLKKPDFIINLPDNRHLIVDSKVSLTNYEAYFNEDDDDIKKQHLKKHIESIRKHIKELGEKKYEALYEINSPDYVLMFVPIEPAYLLALNNNSQLYLDALDKNVVLVSTSTLLATLSTVASMWRQENQKKNVLEIANQAGRLHDQFVNLTNDLIKVGNQLKTVQGSYDSSMKKLTGQGNLVNKVEKIKQLGAKTSKTMNKNLLDRAHED